MWTLRDLWHFFDEEAKQRWRQQQAGNMRGLSDQASLADLLYGRQEIINRSGALHESAFRPPNLKQYQMGMEEGYNNYKHQPPWSKGMI